MDNKQTIVVLVLILVAYFYLVLPFATPFIQQNYIFVFLGITIIYVSIVAVILLGHHPVNDIKKIFALILIFLAFNIFQFPLMLTHDASNPISTTAPLATLSPDIFIYNLLPNFVPHEVKYFFVYIISPALLVIGAVLLTGKKAESIVKMGV
jgi:hypothetical protein